MQLTPTFNIPEASERPNFGSLPGELKMLNRKKTVELHPPKVGKKRAFWGMLGRTVIRLVKWGPAIQGWVEKLINLWE